MSQNQKALKIGSIVLLAWALVVFIEDCFFIGVVGSNNWPGDGILMIVLFSFLVLLAFWVGIKGALGANTPSKANSAVAGGVILSLYLAIVVLMFVLAFIDEGKQAIDGDWPFFIVVTFGLFTALFVWSKAKKVFEKSKDAI